MTDHFDDLAIQMVRDVKAAILRAADDLKQEGLTVSNVSLEIKAVAVKTAEAGLKIKVLDLSADYKREKTQTITLSMTPTDAVEPFAPVAEELEEAIAVISRAASEAAAGPPMFDLDQADIALEVGVTKDGEVKVFVGGAGEWQTTHTLTLTLRPN
jgi:hypothetical protein